MILNVPLMPPDAGGLSKSKLSKEHCPRAAAADGVPPLMTILKNAFYSLRPLNAVFGAEVLGVDLSMQNFEEGFVEQIRRDLVEYRVLLFRKQSPISGAQQVAFSARLGQVESTFYKHPKSPHPDIFRVSNNEAEGCTNVGRSGWHVDGTFLETPFTYQTMYFPQVAAGGDTCFVPLKELYERQSDAVRARWDRYWMVTGRRSSPVHPVVYRHPLRDDPTMVFHCGEPFVNGWLIDDDRLPTAERKPTEMVGARSFQAELTRALEQALEDGVGIKMSWEPGDFSINDNLGLAHYACPGTQKDWREVGLRILHRTTVLGGAETVPMKRDGRRSFFRADVSMQA